MKNFIFIICFSIISFLLPGHFILQEVKGCDEGHPIFLKGEQFDPSMNIFPSIPSGFTIKEYPSHTFGYYLVQFKKGNMVNGKNQLKELGVNIVSYFPEDTFKIRITSEIAKTLKILPIVEWVGIFQPFYKLSLNLKRNGQGAYKITLTNFANIEQITKQIEALGGKVIGNDTILTIVIDSSKLNQIANIEEVEWIENFKVYKLYNDTSANEMRAPFAWGSGYTGLGIQTNIADSGIDTGIDNSGIVGDIHLDFDNRVAHITSWPIPPGWGFLVNNPGADDGASDLDSGHGTHVTGSVAGNGAMSGGNYKGIAYESTITMQALEQWVDTNLLGKVVIGPSGYYLAGIPDDLNELFLEAYNWGSFIHSNSWGGGTFGEYDSSSQDVDEFMWNHKDFLILFAAGNDGADKNADGIIDLGSVTPPATAKNAIAVGAVENLKPTPIPNEDSGTYGETWPEDYPEEPIHSDPTADAGGDGMVAFSSRGPTQDGRIKPDVVAPGTWIASVRSSLATYDGWGDPIDDYYMYMGGTSMSTPLTAGAVALISDFYNNTMSINPSAALIKATLINSATDIPGQYPLPYNEAGPIPNHNEGWGLVNLERAINDHERKFSDSQFSLSSGNMVKFIATVESSSKPGRVTLVWTDYPGTLGAAKALVNDLDLVVKSPTGKLYIGNNFSNGWTLPGFNQTKFDHVNNVECVYIENPEVGTWESYVYARSVPMGPQDFALVADADFNAMTPLLKGSFLTNGMRSVSNSQ